MLYITKIFKKHKKQINEKTMNSKIINNKIQNQNKNIKLK